MERLPACTVPRRSTWEEICTMEESARMLTSACQECVMKRPMHALEEAKETLARTMSIVTMDLLAEHRLNGHLQLNAWHWLMLALNVRTNTTANPETSVGNLWIRLAINPKILQSASRSTLLQMMLSSSGIPRNIQPSLKNQLWPMVPTVSLELLTNLNQTRMLRFA